MNENREVANAGEALSPLGVAIKRYFRCWETFDSSELGKLFTPDAIYFICGKRELRGLSEIETYWRTISREQSQVKTSIIWYQEFERVGLVTWSAKMHRGDIPAQIEIEGHLSIAVNEDGQISELREAYHRKHTELDAPIRTWYQRYRVIVIVVLALWASCYGVIYFAHPAIEGETSPSTGTYAWGRWQFALAVMHIGLPASVIVMEIISLLMLGRETKERREYQDRWWSERRERALDRKIEMEEGRDILKGIQAGTVRTEQMFRRFQAIIGRENYLQNIALGIAACKGQVLFTSATMESSASSREQAAIVNAVTGRLKRGKYEHRGIVAARPSALAGALELMCKANVDVRMADVMCVSRLRFVVIDEQVNILGVAEGEPTLAENHDVVAEGDGTAAGRPSTKSFQIESMMLASALCKKFEELWAKSESPINYLERLIADGITGKARYSKADVVRWLDCHAAGITPDWLCKHSSVFAKLPERSYEDGVSGLVGAET